MKWYRTDERLPNNGEEVLIKVGDDYYLAEYVEKEWTFKLKGGGYLPIKDVYWSAITPPPFHEQHKRLN